MKRLACAAAMLLAALPAAAQNLESGKALFDSHCAVCHQPGGVGIDGLAPPLTANPGRYASTEAERRVLANVGLFGMYGEIESGGKRFNGNMPAFRAALDDAELADVLNYLVFQLSGSGQAKPFSAGELAALRAQTLNGNEVRRQRMTVLGEGVK